MIAILYGVIPVSLRAGRDFFCLQILDLFTPIRLVEKITLTKKFTYGKMYHGATV